LDWANLTTLLLPLYLTSQVTFHIAILSRIEQISEPEKSAISALLLKPANSTSQDLLYCAKAFMMSDLIDSGFVVDAQRAFTLPSLPIKNFSKFHCKTG
jgi:hypothetical protein